MPGEDIIPAELLGLPEAGGREERKNKHDIVWISFKYFARPKPAHLMPPPAAME